MTSSEVMAYLGTLGFKPSKADDSEIKKQIGPITLRACVHWFEDRVEIHGSYRSERQLADTQGMLGLSVRAMLAYPTGLLPVDASVRHVNNRLSDILHQLPELEEISQLRILIYGNEVEKVRELLTSGRVKATTTFIPDRCSMLHLAKSREMMQMMIDFGISPNVVDQRGLTPLHHARRMPQIKALVELGANPNVVDEAGKTLLHGALDEESIRFLLDAGCSVDARDNAGNTPLHGQSEHRSIVALVKAGAEVDAENHYGKTTLAQWLERDDVPKATVMLMLGAEPNYLDVKGRAPVHFVKSRAALQMLVNDFGADPHVIDDAGRTPIFEYRAVDLIATVLSKGVKARVADHTGVTPLHEMELIDAARLLLNRDADVNAQDYRGRTPLHSAAMRAQFHVARCLIENHADLERADEAGNTPLHVAKTAPLLALLMARGGNIDRVNHAGLTVWQANPLFHDAVALLNDESGRRRFYEGLEASKHLIVY